MACPIAQRAPGRLDEPVAVSLEDLVPPDHIYRHLVTRLDLGFMRDWPRELDAERGRPSIEPVVFFKPQRVLFSEGIRSQRQLVEIPSLNLGHRWYLGWALDEPLPDDSRLGLTNSLRATRTYRAEAGRG